MSQILQKDIKQIVLNQIEKEFGYLSNDIKNKLITPSFAAISLKNYITSLYTLFNNLALNLDGDDSEYKEYKNLSNDLINKMDDFCKQLDPYYIENTELSQKSKIVLIYSPRS
jgi:hypothetical protein